jgi:hypothetical protein
MSAATIASALTEQSAPTDAQYAPLGIPCLHGRVSVKRFRDRLGDDPTTLTVLAQFAGVCWVGQPADAPMLSGLVLPRTSGLDGRGRLGIDRPARLRLMVPDIAAFHVVPVHAPGGGVFLVPVNDFVRRVQGVSHVAL